MVSYNFMRREYELLKEGYARYLVDHPDSEVVAHFAGSVPIYRITLNGEVIAFMAGGFGGALKQFVKDHQLNIPQHRVVHGSDNAIATMREAFENVSN